MKSLLLKVSLKYALLYSVISSAIALIAAYTVNDDSASRFIAISTGVLNWILFVVFVSMAHYEFNKKNGSFIWFKDAILIGLVIIGISFVFGFASAYIGMEFILKEKMKAAFSEFNEFDNAALLAQTATTKHLILSSLLGLLIQVLVLFIVITFESVWKIYRKAGKEGWACIVPIYGAFVLLEIVKKPSWWFFLLLIPFVNIVFAIWIVNSLAQRFGKDEGYTIGLLFLPFVFYPLLGMSDLKYIDDEIELANSEN